MKESQKSHNKHEAKAATNGNQPKKEQNEQEKGRLEAADKKNPPVKNPVQDHGRSQKKT